MKTTYLCGGIAGLTDAECNDWRSIAKHFLKTHTLDPMVRDCRGKEGLINAEWLINADVADIKACEFVLVNATKPSWGTAMECVYARQNDCYVVAFNDHKPISPWLSYHCNKIYGTLQDAIYEINKEVERRGYANL